MTEEDTFALLCCLGSQSNAEERKIAEVKYNELKKDERFPLNLVFFLCRTNVLLAKDDVQHARHLCCILLRQLLVNENEDQIYHQMEVQDQINLRAGLFECLSQEQEPAIHSKIAEIVGEMCAYILDFNEWPEVLPFAAESAQSLNPVNRETGLKLLGMVAPSYVDLFTQPAQVSSLVAILSTCIVDKSNEFQVMLAALRMFSNLVGLVSQPSIKDMFLPVLGPCMSGLQTVCGPSGSADIANKYIEILIEMAEHNSSFFGSQLDAIFEFFMDLIEGKYGMTVSPPIVFLIIEFLVTLSESIPKLCRKLKGKTASEQCYYAAKLLPVCAQLMTNLSHDPNWELSGEHEEEDEDDKTEVSFNVGEQSFDRITRSLGLRSTFPVVMQLLKILLSGEAGHWNRRLAGVSIIANYLDVSAKIPEPAQLEQHRSDICATLLACANDSYSRVRAAAFYGLAAFSRSHVAEEMSGEHVDRVIQTLLTSLSISVNPSPRVRNAALIALSALLEVANTSQLFRWASILFGQVISALQDGPVIVQEQSVAVIYSLAESTNGSILANYYESLMPAMQLVLQYAYKERLLQLWGTALECCAMVGEASGREKFRKDALDMMAFLTTVHKDADPESDMNRYLLRSWVRIARCMGNEFVPYLPTVMVKILEAIKQDVCEAQGSYGDSGEVFQALDGRNDVNIVEGDSGWIAVRTTAIEEQTCACELISLLLQRMEEEFFPYVEETVRALSLLLNSPQEDIQIHVITAMPELVRVVAKSGHKEALAVLTSYVLGQLVMLFQSEYAASIVICALQATKKVIACASTDWTRLSSQMCSTETDFDALLTPSSSLAFLAYDQMNSLLNCAKRILRNTIQHRAVLRAEAAVSGEVDADDDDDEEELKVARIQVYTSISGLIRTILRTHGSTFLSLCSSFWLESLCGMLHSHCLPEDQIIAADVTSGILEFGFRQSSNLLARPPELRNQLIEFLLVSMPLLSSCCRSNMCETAHAKCVIAIGIASAQHTSEFILHASEVLNALCGSLNTENKQFNHQHNSRSIAVSTIGLILEHVEPYGLSGFDFYTAWGNWLQYLPLRSHLEEGRKVLQQLLRLVRQRHPSLVGTILENREQVAINILLEVVDTDMIDSALTEDIYSYLHDFLSSTARLDDIFSNLKNPESGFKLKRIIDSRSSSPLVKKNGNVLSLSPGMTAPIHDVLLGGKK